MYTFDSLPNSSTGTTTARMIIMPPIVGVPFFCNCPSKPRSRMSSPICLRRSMFIMRLPKTMAISSDRIMAAAERNEMYWNIPMPGRSVA
jgi:hypothetical protein